MNDLPVFYSDSANLDAFGYLRVGQSQVLFDSKQIKNKQPLNWDDVEVSGSGTSSTYVTDTASTAFGSDTNITIGITSSSTGNSFTIVEADEFETGSSFSLINGEAGITFNGTAGTSGLTLTDNGTTSSIQFTGALGGAMVISSAESYPLQYSADYSANIGTRSIPDVGYIQALTGRYVDAAAAVTGGVVAGEVWFNTTTNKYMVRLS